MCVVWEERESMYKFSPLGFGSVFSTTTTWEVRLGEAGAVGQSEGDMKGT